MLVLARVAGAAVCERPSNGGLVLTIGKIGKAKEQQEYYEESVA